MQLNNNDRCCLLVCSFEIKEEMARKERRERHKKYPIASLQSLTPLANPIKGRFTWIEKNPPRSRLSPHGDDRSKETTTRSRPQNPLQPSSSGALGSTSKEDASWATPHRHASSSRSRGKIRRRTRPCQKRQPHPRWVSLRGMPGGRPWGSPRT